MHPKEQKDRILSNFTKIETHGTLLVRELPLLPVAFEDQEEDCGQPQPATEQALVWNWASPGYVIAPSAPQIADWSGRKSLLRKLLAFYGPKGHEGTAIYPLEWLQSVGSPFISIYIDTPH